MSYCTRYDGQIEIKAERCKDMIKHYLFDDSDNEYCDTLFESKFDYDLGELKIDEDRRNYEGQMESVFDLIVQYDPKAKGEVIAVGEDGEGKERFILENGKVFREEGYIAYKDKKDITDTQDTEEIDEIIDSSISKHKCEKCNKEINLKSFNFKNRGYYSEINEELDINELCKECYKKIKEPFAAKKKLQFELDQQDKKIKKLSDVNVLEGETNE